MKPILNDLVIPPEVFDVARDSLGRFFEPISGLPAELSARDFLDPAKALVHAENLQRYTSLTGRKVLEIGSGFGTNLAVWVKRFSVDGYGVEPGSAGFDAGYVASRQVFRANGLDPSRIVNARAESLPFPDGSFDIVYSSNVLEHADDPELVLREATRILRPGGTLHMEMPNHLSYFEGHYLVVQPPLFASWVLPTWLRLIRRDPLFASTLRTEINPIWCRKTISKIGETYPLELISLGEEIFLERLATRFKFETQGASTRIGSLLRAVQRVNRANWIGKSIVAAKGHFPIYLTATRLSYKQTTAKK